MDEEKNIEESTKDRSDNDGDKKRDWERDLINRLSFASLNEQRRTRRWNVFFKILLFGYLFALLYLAFPADKLGDSVSMHHGDHTAVININGAISDETEANASDIIAALEEAFEDEGTKGIVLRINSPGGSPVQSDYVYKAIKRLRDENEAIPLYAVIADMGASGAYYIASAADKIYVNESSLVGSIGVIMNGFGFVDAIDKMGIERRLYTAGENKGFLDPFSPTKEENVEHIKTMLGEIHDKFIAAVKEGRGDRLKGDESELFSGLVWTGERSVALGLADDLGSLGSVARDVIGEEKIVDFTYRKRWIDRFAERFGAAIGSGVASALGADSRSLLQ